MKDESSGLEKVVIKEPNGSSSEIFLHGGHITSWKNERQEEQLFVSSKAVFKPPKAIRGGIPVCFPQFGPKGPLDQHGYARNRAWVVDPKSETSDPAVVDLLLTPSAEDLKLWPHSFELRMRVALGPAGELTTTVKVLNNDTKPFSFTFALHTYFSISDISEVRIEGLETMDYLDNLRDGARVTDQGDAITFDGELDRIYVSTPSTLTIVDHSDKKKYIIRKEGLPDAVVWNPWEKKSKAMSDMDDEGYLKFVCVEAAAIENSVTLKPGEEWQAVQELSSLGGDAAS